MKEKVNLDHVPTYVFPKSVIIQPKGYIKYVWIVQYALFTIESIELLSFAIALNYLYFYLLFQTSGRPIIA